MTDSQLKTLAELTIQYHKNTALVIKVQANILKLMFPLLPDQQNVPAIAYHIEQLEALYEQDAITREQFKKELGLSPEE